jgi:hypothetical protein
LSKEFLNYNDVLVHVASAKLQVVFSDGFVFRHTGHDSATFDDLMEFDGVPTVAIEVTRVLKQEDQAFIAALDDGQNGAIIPLAPGSGKWAAGLMGTTRVKNQTSSQYQNVVDLLNDEGQVKSARLRRSPHRCH